MLLVNTDIFLVIDSCPTIIFQELKKAYGTWLTFLYLIIGCLGRPKAKCVKCNIVYSIMRIKSDS